MEMMEYRNSTRRHLLSPETKSAIEYYLEGRIHGPTMKKMAHGTCAFSEMLTETVNQLVSLPWRAVVLRHSEEKMRTTPERDDDWKVMCLEILLA